jgi:sarcosine oxidase subunit gamma
MRKVTVKMSNALNAMLQSPLHAFGLHARVATPTSDNRVLLSELPHLGYLVLRGKADDAAFMQAVASALGQPLPTQPMTVLPTAAGVVLWLSPDEWLLLCQRSARDALLAKLTTALQDLFAQVVDNSGGFTTLRLAGPDHMMLLRQLSPYDFERLAVGRCASTVLSKAGMTVVRTDSAGVLLVFRRSFADYIWRLLERTAQPYRPCITHPDQCADPVFTPLFETV